MDLPTTTDALRVLIRDHGPDAVSRSFRKPPISSQVLRALSEENPTEAAWIFLAMYALSPSSLLEEIGAHSADYPSCVLVPLAQNPRTPPGTLTQLRHHSHDEVKAAAATNPNLPARDLEELLGEPNPTVWRAIAANPGLKFRMQAMLAARGDASVRLELCQNKALHPDLLVALTGDPSPLVRYTLVASTSADDEMLQFWADSDREEIQLALMSRNKLPEAVWQSLLMSPHASVRRAVCEKHPLDAVDMLFLSRSEDRDDRLFLAEHKDVAAGLQHSLVQDAEAEVRVTLARNASIWPEVAEFMITGEDTPACLALMQNPAMPETLFLELGWLNQPSVTAALASYDKTPEEVLQYLANEQLSAVALAHMAINQRPAPWLRAELADHLAQHALPSLRALAATSLQLSESARTRLRSDPAPRVQTLAYEFPPSSTFAPSTVKTEALQRCLEDLAAIIDGQSPALNNDNKPFQK